jgi:hypothetical protein
MRAADRFPIREDKLLEVSKRLVVDGSDSRLKKMSFTHSCAVEESCWEP